MEVVLGTIGAGVLSLDAEGRITTVNPTARRQLGIAPGASPIGGRLADCAGQLQLRDLIVDLGGKLRPAARESIRRQAQVPLGEDLATLLVTVTLLHDEAGGVLGTVVVLDDYTQPVKVQRMVAWREVASRIAHEIKNPLTPIQLSAQRIRRRFRPRVDADPDDSQGLRRVRRRHHQPGRRPQAAGRRVLELRAAADGESRRPAT